MKPKYEIIKSKGKYYITKRYLFVFRKFVPDAGFAYKPFVRGCENLGVVKRVMEERYT